MEVTHFGVLAISIQPFLFYHFKPQFVKTLIEVSLPVLFSVLRNFDDVLHIRYLNCQPFLVEAWPTWSGVLFASQDRLF